MNGRNGTSWRLEVASGIGSRLKVLITVGTGRRQIYKFGMPKCRPCGVCVVAFLSPLRGLLISLPPPTACAVGCILSPLRGCRPVAYSTFSSDVELWHSLLRDSCSFFSGLSRGFRPGLSCGAASGLGLGGNGRSVCL